MSDLKTEIEQKVLPVLGDWQREEAERDGNGHAGESSTGLVYDSVRSNPGQTAAFHQMHLNGRVHAVSISSLLSQLCKRGYVEVDASTYPSRYTVTAKPFVPREVPSHVRQALVKAQEARRVKAEAKRTAKAAKPANGRKRPGPQPGWKERAAAKRAEQALQKMDGVNIDVSRLTYGKEVAAVSQLFPAPKSPQSAAEVVAALDVRTARAVMDELMALFGVK